MKSRAATLCFVSVFVCSSTAHLYGRAKVNLVAKYNQDGPKVVTELSIPQMRCAKTTTSRPIDDE